MQYVDRRVKSAARIKLNRETKNFHAMPAIYASWKPALKHSQENAPSSTQCTINRRVDYAEIIANFAEIDINLLQNDILCKMCEYLPRNKNLGVNG